MLHVCLLLAKNSANACIRFQARIRSKADSFSANARIRSKADSFSAKACIRSKTHSFSVFQCFSMFALDPRPPPGPSFFALKTAGFHVWDIGGGVK
jgi:hypothetical protein